MIDKVVRVMPYMCKQQKEDIDAILAAADDIGAAATSVAQGGLGYTQLIEARDRFKVLLCEAQRRYRVYEEIEV